MDIVVYIDKKPSYKLPIQKYYKVFTIKKYLKDNLKNFDNANKRFFLNKEEELIIFNNDKYDNLELKEIWGKLLNPKIYVKTDSEKNIKEVNINMEKLNSDEKIMILMNLSAKEIVNTCKTNKDLSRVCNDGRYNSLWIKKIKDDFAENYNGNNAYEEYKRLYILLKTPIYTVHISYEDITDTENYNFTSLEKAKAFIHLFFDEYFKEFLEDNEDEGRDNDKNRKYIEKEKKTIDELELNSRKNISGYYVSIYQSYLNDRFAYYNKN